jgi:hypothetical protein
VERDRAGDALTASLFGLVVRKMLALGSEPSQTSGVLIQLAAGFAVYAMG